MFACVSSCGVLAFDGELGMSLFFLSRMVVFVFVYVGVCVGIW